MNTSIPNDYIELLYLDILDNVRAMLFVYILACHKISCLNCKICLKLFIIHLKFTKPSTEHLPVAKNKMQKVNNIFMLVVWIGMCENLITSSVSSKIDELQKIRTGIMYKHMGHI